MPFWMIGSALLTLTLLLPFEHLNQLSWRLAAAALAIQAFGIVFSLVGPVPITSGKSGERTPTGTHRVLWKDKDHLSREFDDAPMPYSVFFAAGGIAFHTGSLRAQSSGCIHLADSTAKRFFANLAVGDVVQVLK